MYTCVPTFSPRSFLSSIAHCERSWERRSRGKEQGVVKGEQRGPDRRRSFHTGREFWEIINIVQHGSLCSALSVSRAVKRTVNGQARKRARGSPRRHLTLPLGEEVLLPLFKASLPSFLSPPPMPGSRFIACLDRPTPRQIKALNITGGRQASRKLLLPLA